MEMEWLTKAEKGEKYSPYSIDIDIIWKLEFDDHCLVFCRFNMFVPLKELWMQVRNI